MKHDPFLAEEEAIYFGEEVIYKNEIYQITYLEWHEAVNDFVYRLEKEGKEVVLKGREDFVLRYPEKYVYTAINEKVQRTCGTFQEALEEIGYEDDDLGVIYKHMPFEISEKEELVIVYESDKQMEDIRKRNQGKRRKAPFLMESKKEKGEATIMLEEIMLELNDLKVSIEKGEVLKELKEKIEQGFEEKMKKVLKKIK